MSLDVGHTAIVLRLLLLGIAGLLLGGGTPGASDAFLAPVSISFWNTREGVASFVDWHSCGPHVRCRGAIETTQDGGRTWNIRWRGPVVRSVDAVPGSRQAWAAVEPVHSCGTRLPQLCRTTLLHSGDGGVTWVRTAAYVTAPDFADARHGFGVRGPVLVGTGDGGRTWRELARPCRGFEGAVASFVSARRGWMLCAGSGGAGVEPKSILGTADGGHRWVLLMRTTFTRHTPGALPRDGYPGGVDFADARTGWVWESRGNLYSTRDSGRTWRSASITSPETVEAESTSFPRPLVGLVLLSNQRTRRYELRLTRDGGHAFELVRTWPIP